jgi:hypothetical protein
MLLQATLKSTFKIYKAIRMLESKLSDDFFKILKTTCTPYYKVELSIFKQIYLFPVAVANFALLNLHFSFGPRWIIIIFCLFLHVLRREKLLMTGVWMNFHSQINIIFIITNV